MGVIELEIHSQERILAPIALVWDELSSLVAILAKSPEISDCDVTTDGRRARGKVRLAWGPVKWSIELSVRIVRCAPPRRHAFTIDGSVLGLRYHGTLDLTATGEMVTRLDYRGHLEVHHRLAGRTRQVFREIGENHSRNFVRSVKVKAEQRRLAQEMLL